jgi:hypothetical protein
VAVEEFKMSIIGFLFLSSSDFGVLVHQSFSFLPLMIPHQGILFTLCSSIPSTILLLGEGGLSNIPHLSLQKISNFSFSSWLTPTPPQAWEEM